MKNKLKNKFIAGIMSLAILATSAIPATTVNANTDSLPPATNITFNTARDLKFDTSIAEELTSSDNLRYYKFYVDSACEFIVRGTKSTNAWRDRLYVYDASKTKLNETSFYEPINCSLHLTGGWYYLQFESKHSLSFIASVNMLDESFKETQDTNNNLISTASPISLLTKYKGVLTINDDIDYYKFTVPSAGKINFNMTNATNGNVKYYIYDSSMQSVHLNVVKDGKNVSDFVTLSQGTYYLAITKENLNKGTGSYNFQIDYIANQIKAPKIMSVKNSGKKKMKITWSGASNVSGYELQYSTSKNFKKNTKTKKISAKKTNVTISKLKKGKKYYVRMRSYSVENGTKNYSKWSGKKSVKIKK